MPTSIVAHSSVLTEDGQRKALFSVTPDDYGSLPRRNPTDGGATVLEVDGLRFILIRQSLRYIRRGHNGGRRLVVVLVVRMICRCVGAHSHRRCRSGGSSIGSRRIQRLGQDGRICRPSRSRGLRIAICRALCILIWIRGHVCVETTFWRSSAKTPDFSAHPSHFFRFTCHQECFTPKATV